ncbi:hypothetical protein FIS3754_45080 [Fischerella sp. NIES-3754]|nr:hypothetical protein FIS3754_45080 [Fischerella sp. NIES-3754]BCX10939.1 MAG: hypothetical protein KatS3mg066_4798 [Fischerella sp.]
MSERTHQATADHSVGNIMIISFLALCGLTVIFLLGIF